MAFKFENLQVWQKALDLSDEINILTRNFPKDELYILTSQIKRAADSVVLNIAEGCTGQSNAVFKAFLNYSIRSGVEVVSCLFIGQKRGFISSSEFKKHYDNYEALIKMITALRNSI